MLEVLHRILFGVPELSMAIGPLAVGLLSAVAGPVAGALFGGGGGGGGQSASQANPQLAEQSKVETDLLKQQQQIIAQLMEMAGNYTGGPIGELDLPDSRFLDEGFLGSLEPSRDIELLQSLLGRSVGSGATGALANLDQRQNEFDFRADQSQGQSISGIIDSLITAFQGRDRGPAPGPSPVDVAQQFFDPQPQVNPFSTFPDPNSQP